MKEKIERISVNDLHVEDQQHRLDLDIDALADSIQHIGQINPITVKKTANGYRVISGRRRYAALHRLQERTNKWQEALVYVKDVDELHEELIKIDENLMRVQLGGAEFDESLYRRKQLYEELFPETRAKVAGGAGKAAARTGRDRKAAFTADASQKLGVTRRTVEKAIARAARASDSVKEARKEGRLTPSKVDLLVGLPAKDQDQLLPLVQAADLAKARELVDQAHRRGARAVVLTHDEEKHDPAELNSLSREAARLIEMLDDAVREDLVFRSKTRHESVKLLERLEKSLGKFLKLQRAKLNYVRAIHQRGGARRTIHHR